MEVVPEAEQCISYGMPAFKVEGKTVAGFAAFKNHLSYLPHSGSVLSMLPDDIAPYESTKGALEVRHRQAAPETPGEEARHHANARARLAIVAHRVVPLVGLHKNRSEGVAAGSRRGSCCATPVVTVADHSF